MCSDKNISFVVFIIALLIFIHAPVLQIMDSDYSIMLSESMIHYFTPRLDHFNISKQKPYSSPGIAANGYPYQLEAIGNKLYYMFPNVPSFLNIPFVMVANGFGISATTQDGNHNTHGESVTQKYISAFLMAIYTVIAYCFCRILLPRITSIFVTSGSVLGTSILSTASRAVWSDTWGVLLLMAALFLLIHKELGSAKSHPVLKATLLSWSFFCKPTYAISIVSISSYIFLFDRPSFNKYMTTGLIWLTLFICLSEYQFNTVLPNYFMPMRLNSNTFWEAMAGNLISPSRGIFVFSPVIVFVCFLCIKYFRQMVNKSLLVLSVTSILLHLIAISKFPHWWAGHSYGPRFMLPVLPWFLLIAILSISAWLSTTGSNTQIVHILHIVTMYIGCVLMLISICIHVNGAFFSATDQWNACPSDIDIYPQRAWDWRYPQFLAGLISVPNLTTSCNN